MTIVGAHHVGEPCHSRGFFAKTQVLSTFSRTSVGWGRYSLRRFWEDKVQCCWNMSKTRQQTKNTPREQVWWFNLSKSKNKNPLRWWKKFLHQLIWRISHVHKVSEITGGLISRRISEPSTVLWMTLSWINICEFPISGFLESKILTWTKSRS